MSSDGFPFEPYSRSVRDITLQDMTMAPGAILASDVPCVTLSRADMISGSSEAEGAGGSPPLDLRVSALEMELSHYRAQSLRMAALLQVQRGQLPPLANKWRGEGLVKGDRG